MEDGLVLEIMKDFKMPEGSLNPCCNGRWSRTHDAVKIINEKGCLNPCCNGRWSRTQKIMAQISVGRVLILVVMEDGLVLDLIRLY